MNAHVLISLAIAILFIALPASAQKTEFSENSKKYRSRYIDKINTEEEIKKSWDNYVITKSKDGKYFARVYYPQSEQIKSHEQYKSKDLIHKHGLSKQWYSNGTIKSEGNYKEHLKVGQWKYYNKLDGSLSSTGRYKYGSKNGIWTELESGDTTAIYTYEVGLKYGPFIEFDSTGNIAYKGMYTLDQKPMLKSETCDEIENYFVRKDCADREMYQLLNSNKYLSNYSRKNRVPGNVLIHFTVTKNGNIENIKILRGKSTKYEKAYCKSIQDFPKFHPGLVNGKPADMIVDIAITWGETQIIKNRIFTKHQNVNYPAGNPNY